MKFLSLLRPPVSSSAPASPTKGDCYVDNATGHLHFYNGSAWINYGNAVSDAIAGSDMLQLSRRKSVTWWRPRSIDNFSPTLAGIGVDGTDATVTGTGATRTWGTFDSANALGRTQRIVCQSGTAEGNRVTETSRATPTTALWLGNSAGLGGFVSVFAFGFEQLDAGACNLFVGHCPTVDAGDYPYQDNCLGLVQAVNGLGQTTWHWRIKGTGTATMINTGVTPTVDVLYVVRMSAAANATQINLELYADGSLVDSDSFDSGDSGWLSSTTALSPPRFEANVAFGETAASATQLALVEHLSYGLDALP